MCLVRFLNSTVMVRVGGGWQRLDEFLETNDPCRGTRMPLATSAPAPHRPAHAPGLRQPRHAVESIRKFMHSAIVDLQFCIDLS